ncbi:hypothetical protein DAEQUDRAFT_724551, partial [Daedalea quercina L-15889]
MPPAVFHRDKCRALREELFQPPPRLDGCERPDLSNQHPDDIPFVELTKYECRQAIFDAAPHKAPGPNGVPAVALRWAWEAAGEEMFALMSACVRAGHHPSIWHESIAVALRKPNKKDYSQPRSYRLIQLL